MLGEADLVNQQIRNWRRLEILMAEPGSPSIQAAPQIEVVQPQQNGRTTAAAGPRNGNHGDQATSPTGWQAEPQ